MADSEAARAPGPRPEAVLERVLDVVRALARETGGPRAERAVSPEASLEREVGLGSLERVELVARLERAFGRALDDRCLALDTAAGLARALVDGRRRPGPVACPRARRRSAPPPTSAPACARSTSRSGATRTSTPARVHVFLRDDPASRPPGGASAAPGTATESEEAITYGRLRDEAAAVAGGLRERGVARGDTVALDAADRPRLPALLPRHPARARRPGADLPARPPRPARGVRRPPVRHPGRRRRAPPRHDPARAARGRAS